MLDHFKNHINTVLPFLKESRLLIAISGGIDSVVLAHLCHNLNLDVSLAHCNFKLRGMESDVDEQFVMDLGKQWHLEVFVQKFNTEVYAKSHKLSIQMAARELRYDWLSDLAERLGFDYILTAHHADDNLETFLINFTRGTGLNGLTGIPLRNGKFVRPLLSFSRNDIECFAKSQSVKWREDSSNSSRKYLRNKLRHEVVPVLKDINPQLLESFQKTIDNLTETSEVVADSIETFKKRAVKSSTKNETRYHISEFLNMSNPKAYLFEIFKDYGFSEWNDVLDLLNAQSGKQVFSNTHRLIKHRELLILTQLKSENQENLHDHISIFERDVKLKTNFGILFFDEADAIFNASKNIMHIDKGRLKYPLELRRWRAGDVFYPMGMKGKKKVSKYLKDEKLSILAKENVWVITSDDSIVWVVGMRGDERYKVTDSTKEILKIELLKDSNEPSEKDKSKGRIE